MEVKEYLEVELSNLRNGLIRYLDGLDHQEILWRPAYGCASIGLILLHMSRFEDLWVQTCIQSKPEIWHAEQWYKTLDMDEDTDIDSYVPDQISAFSVPDAKDLVEYFNTIRNLSLEYIKDLTSEGLDRKVTVDQREEPIHNVFGIIAQHMAQHMGAVTYLRNMQRGMKIGHR